MACLFLISLFYEIMHLFGFVLVLLVLPDFDCLVTVKSTFEKEFYELDHQSILFL
jgi:hypothetical protein